jgi:hypothetical protein
LTANLHKGGVLKGPELSSLKIAIGASGLEIDLNFHRF